MEVLGEPVSGSFAFFFSKAGDAKTPQPQLGVARSSDATPGWPHRGGAEPSVENGGWASLGMFGSKVLLVPAWRILGPKGQICSFEESGQSWTGKEEKAVAESFLTPDSCLHDEWHIMRMQHLHRQAMLLEDLVERLVNTDRP